MKKKLIIFGIVLIAAISLPVLVAKGQMSLWYNLEKNTNMGSVYISHEAGFCTISNSSLINNYFIPLKSYFEWLSVKTHKASGLNINCNSCIPKTCSDKTGLAAVNNGLNCGLSLNDGCGNIIDCLSCASGQVCALGRVGSPCDLSNLGNCAYAISAGFCDDDRDCNPVIDVAGVQNRGRIACVGSGIIDINTCPALAEAYGIGHEIDIINGTCYVGTGSLCANVFPGQIGQFYKMSVNGSNIWLGYRAYFIDGKFFHHACDTNTGGGGGGGGGDPIEVERLEEGI